MSSLVVNSGAHYGSTEDIHVEGSDINNLMRSVNIESNEKPLTKRNTSIYNISDTEPIGIEAKKNKTQTKEYDLIDTTNSKSTKGGWPLNHRDSSDTDREFVDGDLLFRLDGEEVDGEFEGGTVGEYFSW